MTQVKGGFVQGNRRFPVFPVLWLNLARCQDRRKHMETVLTDPIFDKMQKIRIEAIDGKFANLADYIVSPQSSMAKSEYGCIISHLEAIRQFAQTNNPYALILEDDICLDFKPYWKKTINEIIEEAPKDWEILQLCYIIKKYIPQQDYELHTPNKDMWSTAAYLITNQAAKRLMNKIGKTEKFDLSHTKMHQADRFLYQNCRTYTYKDCPFIYRTNNDSTIFPDFVYYHENSKKQIELMLKNNQKQQSAQSWNNVAILLTIIVLIAIIIIYSYSH